MITEKRFKLRLSKLGDGMITDTQKREDLYFDKEFLDVTLSKTNEWLNELADENEQLKKENYELHKRLGDFEQFEEHIKERTSKTFVKKCVYFNSVLGVCDIDRSVDCPCENYEGLVRWIDD